MMRSRRRDEEGILARSNVLHQIMIHELLWNALCCKTVHKLASPSSGN